MVLSNKKLKQKLRAALAESLASKENNNSNKSQNADPVSHPQSLKHFLTLNSSKPRLSKREKRRKRRPLSVGSEEGGKEILGNGEVCERKDLSDAEEVGAGEKTKGEDSEGMKKKKMKKRKRENGEEEGGSESLVEGVRKNKRKKKKVKKKKKKDEKEKNSDATNEENKDAFSFEDRVNEANSQESIDAAKKVYVGGIPYYSTEDDIRSYFESCGTITEVDCMTFPETGKFRGIAIISFKTEAAGKRALDFDGSDMGGFFLKIQPYKATRANRISNFAPPAVEGYNRIYLGNLSWEITEDDVRKFFSGCNVKSIRFGMDKETGEFRGYAHVDFSDSLSMNMALKLDQATLCGRPVKIMCAIPKSNTNPKPFPKSSATPQLIPLKSVPSNSGASDQKANNVADSSRTDNGVADINTSAISSGKMKRRTCYVCGEKGHISSACPKKPTDGSSNADAA